MRHMLRTIVAAVVLAGAALPAAARPIIDWDPVYFWEAGAGPFNSNPGGQLNIVGTISAFGGPLEFLNANIPTNEYTLYMTGMTSNGTITTPVGSLGFYYYTPYNTGGTIEIYEDTTPDAVFGTFPPNGTAPSTFNNGTLLLSGTIDPNTFYTQTNDFSGHSSGNSEGRITWTGGSLIGLLQQGGETCPSLFTGGLTWEGTLVPDGYLFRHDGKIDLECPTGARNSTWGRMKSLYR